MLRPAQASAMRSTAAMLRAWNAARVSPPSAAKSGSRARQRLAASGQCRLISS